jgi:uncharacterized protein YjcR
MTKNNGAGAPAGNKNALKHGFYQKKFTRKEKSHLTRNKDQDLESEINAVRTIAARILDRLNQAGLSDEDTGAINDQTIKTLHTFIDAVTAISTLTRSHMLTTGQYLPVETAIMDALAELNQEDEI